MFESDAAATPWKELPPKPPFYLFVPRDVNLQVEYDKGWKVTEIFPVSSVGVVTARDRLTIHWSRDEVWSTVQDFAGLPVERARDAYNLGEDTRDWKVHLAQDDIKSSGTDAKHIVPILYRPFDVRYTYYTGQTRGFICMPRRETMRHMLAGKNLGMIVPRRVEVVGGWQHVLCTGSLPEHVAVSLKTIDSLFPLYVYPETEKKRQLPGGGSVTILSLLESQPEYMAPSPNLSPAFVAAAAKALGLEFITSGKGDRQTTFRPEDIFHYIYAVFHSPTYRTRYAEFLKTDFPRVPLTSDRELFKTLAAKGEELVSLHLMESRRLNGELVTRFPVGGPDVVEAVRYVENPPEEEKPAPSAPPPPEPFNRDLPLEFHEKRVKVPVPPPPEPRHRGRIYMNKTQYFEGVPPEVWEFQVGGYQVCDKWLKDRKGRKLLFDDLWHYQKIIVALKETIRLMEEIDNAIPE